MAGFRWRTWVGSSSHASTPGTYTLRVFATDAGGLRSNVLGGTIRIAEFPWKTKTASSIGREYAAVAELDGRLYVLGGERTDTGIVPGPATNAVQVYDPATDTGSAAPPMPTARMKLVAAVVDGRLYAIGGSTSGFTAGATDVVEAFDPRTRIWTTRASMPSARSDAAGAAVKGAIVVAGGQRDDGAILDTVESYDPSTDSWATRVARPTPRKELAAVALDGKRYTVGGDAGLVPQWVGTVEAFDPVTDRWSSRAPMVSGRSMLALATVGGTLFAAGGQNVSRALDLLERYDPATNAWSTKTPSPREFTRAGAGVANAKLYVIGNGWTLEYDPANEIR